MFDKPWYSYDPYEENYFLRKRVLQLQRELAEKERKETEAIDLLMKGEALRQRMMFNAIIDGVIPRCN